MIVFSFQVSYALFWIGKKAECCVNNNDLFLICKILVVVGLNDKSLKQPQQVTK